MTDMFNHPTPPNAAKLIDSLRYLGYDNYQAVADLVDNSIDADAKTIKVLAHMRGGEPEIVIADNGFGMDEEVLDQAIRLGSEAEKDPASDLGKFGMGLCTASLSICRQTTVLTRTAEGRLLKAINDVDEVKRLKEFFSFLGEADEDDASFFKELLADSSSGTVVVLRKCDNIQNRNLTLFSRTLINHLGRVFRYFISAERGIFVNQHKLEAIDPLIWKESEHYDDAKLPIKVEYNGKSVEDTVHIKLAVLPDKPGEGERQKGYSMRDQGFYILRNNREISSSETLGLFMKHPSLNRFRGEINFSGRLDEQMGVAFTKQGIRLRQSVEDQLGNYLRGQVTTIRTKLDRSQRIETAGDVAEVHKSAEDEIRKKSKLLLTPKAPKELRQSRSTNEVKTKPSSSKPSTTREPGERQQPGGFSANCKFETASMTEAGPIYEAAQQGRTVIVRWNSDHPFYKRFVLDNIGDKGIVAAADFLVYSLACAELMWCKDDTVELIHNFKTAMSSNVRTLLS